jgi:hypothetical protein
VSYQLALSGDPQLSVSGGTITVTYNTTNNGDSETGGTWDKAVVADQHGAHVLDSSRQVHSLQPGDNYEGKIDQLQDVGHGSYTVSLVIDSESTGDAAWSGQVTVS